MKATEFEPDDSLEVAREKLARGLSSLGAEAGITQAIAPVLSYLLGVEEACPRDLDPEQLKRQIVLAARLLVERRLEQGPLLAIVDDLHWADAASVDLLRDLADHPRPRRHPLRPPSSFDPAGCPHAQRDLPAGRLAVLGHPHVRRPLDRQDRVLGDHDRGGPYVGGEARVDEHACLKLPLRVRHLRLHRDRPAGELHHRIDEIHDAAVLLARQGRDAEDHLWPTLRAAA